ncbi:hypothetical protein MNBD_GAMMA12-3924, partial [hydrothermal vent metagenome]
MAANPGRKRTAKEFFSKNGSNYLPGIGCTIEVLYQAFKDRHEDEMEAQIREEIRQSEITTMTFEVVAHAEGDIEMSYWLNDGEGVHTRNFQQADQLDDFLE